MSDAYLELKSTLEVEGTLSAKLDGGSAPAKPVSLNELSDVSIVSATDGQILTYNGESEKWNNSTLSVDSGDVSYDNTSSGIEATNLQDAVDEIVSDLGTKTNTWRPIRVMDNDFLSSDTTLPFTIDFVGASVTSDGSTGKITVDCSETQDADDISYDNTTSGLIATNVQDAIDEVVADRVKFITLSNITVESTDWSLQSTPDFDGYSYVATITVQGVTSSDLAEVIPSLSAITSGKLCPLNMTVSNGVQIYASEALDEDITIEVVSIRRIV